MRSTLSFVLQSQSHEVQLRFPNRVDCGNDVRKSLGPGTRRSSPAAANTAGDGAYRFNWILGIDRYRRLAFPYGHSAERRFCERASKPGRHSRRQSVGSG